MDFEMLSRRELQALCKKNKIPANMTNLAMTDALKALKIVEGIEEFMHPSQSETAQSSIESPEKNEVTSPYVPPTGGRTTRRRNITKEEPETLQPTTRTRRTTRKTQSKDADELKADATETPAVVQTRRRAPVTSVCRKMDSQLKECAEEKDVLVTPAPSGVASRRRRGVKEESVVQRVYSTRRSTRLAEKNVQKLGEVENEISDVKKDLFTKDGGENVKLDDLDETSGTTGQANSTVEENIEGKDESEVVSAEEQPKPIGEESKHSSGGFDANITVEENIEGKDDEFSAEEQPKPIGEESKHSSGRFDTNTTVEENIEGKDDESQVVSAAEQHMTIGEEEMGHDFEADGLKQEEKEVSDFQNEKVGSAVETEAEVDEEKCEKSEDPIVENLVMHLNVSNEVEESDGMLYHEKVGSAVETEAEVDEENCEKSEDPNVENLVMPLNVSNEVEESDESHHDYASETEVAVENTENLNMDEITGFEDKAHDTVENVVLESEDKFAEDSFSNEIEKEMINDKDMHFEDVPDSNANEEVLEINDVGEKDIMLDESPKSEILEAKKEKTDDVISQDTDDSTTNISAPLNLNADSSENRPTSGIYDDKLSHQIVKSTCLTPVKRMPVVSDNKENIDSGSKFIFTKERVKISKNTAETKLDDLSVRQLTKMLKEKLIITKQLTKTEDSKVPARVALQAVPENRLVDESKN